MDKVEFNAMMEQIDEELRIEGMPIPNRPIAAGCEVSKRLKITIPFFPRVIMANEGNYNELTFAAHIEDWYESRYGDRLKIHLGPGSVALLIKNEPWRLVLPRIYGSVYIVCDPDIEKYRNILCVSQGEPINVLNSIEKFPAGLAKLLTIEEREQIHKYFLNSLNCLEKIEKVSNKPYIKEAKADLEASVSHIFTEHPQYGLSKWSSLQFIEKLFKSFLKLKKEPIPRSHDLSDLSKRCKYVGLGWLNSHILAMVQCKAGVRYGEIRVTLQEAIAAHHAALALSMKLTKEINLIGSDIH